MWLKWQGPSFKAKTKTTDGEDTHTQPWEESNTWWEFCLSGDFESPSLELCGGIVVERTKNKLQGKHVYIHGAIPGQWTTKGYKGDKDHWLNWQGPTSKQVCRKTGQHPGK